MCDLHIMHAGIPGRPMPFVIGGKKPREMRSRGVISTKFRTSTNKCVFIITRLMHGVIPIKNRTHRTLNTTYMVACSEGVIVSLTRVLC